MFFLRKFISRAQNSSSSMLCTHPRQRNGVNTMTFQLKANRKETENKTIWSTRLITQFLLPRKISPFPVSWFRPVNTHWNIWMILLPTKKNLDFCPDISVPDNLSFRACTFMIHVSVLRLFSAWFMLPFVSYLCGQIFVLCLQDLTTCGTYRCRTTKMGMLRYMAAAQNCGIFKSLTSYIPRYFWFL